MFIRTLFSQWPILWPPKTLTFPPESRFSIKSPTAYNRIWCFNQPTFQRPPPSPSSGFWYQRFQVLHGGVYSGYAVSSFATWPCCQLLSLLLGYGTMYCSQWTPTFRINIPASFFGVDPTGLLLFAMDIYVVTTAISTWTELPQSYNYQPSCPGLC
jgi:hypothetical protein